MGHVACDVRIRVYLFCTLYLILCERIFTTLYTSYRRFFDISFHIEKIFLTRYEKTCQKLLFIEIALLVSTERSCSALFNGAKTKIV